MNRQLKPGHTVGLFAVLFARIAHTCWSASLFYLSIMARLLLLVVIAGGSACSSQADSKHPATAILYTNTFFSPPTTTPLCSYHDSLVLHVMGKRAPLLVQ